MNGLLRCVSICAVVMPETEEVLWDNAAFVFAIAFAAAAAIAAAWWATGYFVWGRKDKKMTFVFRAVRVVLCYLAMCAFTALAVQLVYMIFVDDSGEYFVIAYRDQQGALQLLLFQSVLFGVLFGAGKKIVRRIAVGRADCVVPVPFDFGMCLAGWTVALIVTGVRGFSDLSEGVLWLCALGISAFVYTIFWLVRGGVTGKRESIFVLLAGILYCSASLWWLELTFNVSGGSALERSMIFSVVSVAASAFLLFEAAYALQKYVEYRGALKELALLIEGKNFDALPEEAIAIVKGAPVRFALYTHNKKYAEAEKYFVRAAECVQGE